MRVLRCAVCAAALLLAVAAVPAFGHASFLGSDPAPGARLPGAPAQITLRFTENINRALSTAALYDVASGKRLSTRVAFPGAARLLLTPGAAVARGSYRVEWHSVSADDGHSLEGSFSFGVNAAAMGGASSTQASPLASLGWLRVLVRAVLYSSLFVFAGALGLEALLTRRLGPWLLPPAVLKHLGAGGGGGPLLRRYRSLVFDAGLLAAAAATASALLDAQNAAGGFSGAAIRDFLLANTAGVARVAVVGCVALALISALRSRRVASLPAALALGAIAASGHANSASPRVVAIMSDWTHLLAGALWIGGIAVIVITWAPLVRAGTVALRLALMRDVLARFGRVALPAFLVVVLSGAVNAYIQLGRVAALWQTGYGRILAAKIVLVGLVAVASFTHALRLRPRVLAANPHPDERSERRHWRLLGSEPLLGAGVALAVAFLVAFPLPRDTARASAGPLGVVASCDPCPLPTPRADELAVADEAGSNLVAAWIRRLPGRLAGELRVEDLEGKPTPAPFEIQTAQAVSVSCGLGCRRFTIPAQPATLSVTVTDQGRQYTAVLPTTWQTNQSARARGLLNGAQAAMRRLLGVREVERVNSVPGLFAITSYALQAPNRLAYTTSVQKGPAGTPAVEGRFVAINKTQWQNEGPLGWQKGSFGGGLPFSTSSWFTWTSYGVAVRLLTTSRVRGRPTAVVALMDPGTPAWWRLRIDVPSLRVTDSRLITTGHYMTQRFFDFNGPIKIRAPAGASP